MSLNPLSLKIASIAFAAGVAVGAVPTGVILTKLHKGEIAAQKLQDARDLAKAVEAARKQERAQTALSEASGAKQAETQERIVYRTIETLKEVPVYVTAETDARTCIPWGLVRLLDAAAQGLSAAELPTPAGQPDDACAPIAASALAAGVTANYGTARQNAAQLDALIADVKARAEIVNEP